MEEDQEEKKEDQTDVTTEEVETEGMTDVVVAAVASVEVVVADNHTFY